MKFQLTFKDPDGVSYGLEDAKLDQNDLPDDVERALRKFVQYQEYVTIEIDTNQMSAKVISM